MDKEQIRDSFFGNLQKMYDMELVAPLMEFCQGEMRVLLYLDSHKTEEIYPSDLSDSLYVTRQRITSILAALRKKEFIVMETSDLDRRRMRITLSKAGRLHVAEKRKFVESYFDMLLEGMGEENILELTRMIELAAEKMEGFAK